MGLAVGLAAKRHDGALPRPDDAGHHGHVIADHLVEIERGFGLVDQRRDVPDIDGLMQIDKLAVLPEAIKELAKVFLHFLLRSAD
jgi:hypothetical protein